MNYILLLSNVKNGMEKVDKYNKFNNVQEIVILGNFLAHHQKL